MAAKHIWSDKTGQGPSSLRIVRKKKSELRLMYEFSARKIVPTYILCSMNTNIHTYTPTSNLIMGW